MKISGRRRGSIQRAVQLCLMIALIGSASPLAAQSSRSLDQIPSLGEPVAGAARPPTDRDELRYWLTNMIAFHGLSLEEIRAATGLDDAEIKAQAKEFELEPFSKLATARQQGLVVLPYPGGRHPRIGFLDGAVRPQRETKFSVFLPWESGWLCRRRHSRRRSGRIWD